ncbi:ribbon-helix-helix protein, CopG family [Corynebacterium sputi]|uniref:ribbon-helix-helix protein, CopG family n=1 Tax=Corynebacterium sputi TaxID=489915 RepID=UPI0004258D2E|nr:ribbon-helix-helix protein, CopG family [Corynebacterium sputi]
MTKSNRTPDDYAAMAAEFERGDYDPIGPANVNSEYRKGRPRKGDSRNSHPISLRLNEQDVERLESYLLQSRRERSEVLREAISQYLTEHGA